MGNSYYNNVTQWSKGEYSNANNTQNDLTVMQSYGLPLRVDDYGNTMATASFLPTGSQVIVSGNVERNTDLDVIGFVTGAGNISLTLTPAMVLIWISVVFTIQMAPNPRQSTCQPSFVSIT
jgi:hypothetical protein